MGARRNERKCGQLTLELDGHCRQQAEGNGCDMSQRFLGRDSAESSRRHRSVSGSGESKNHTTIVRSAGYGHGSGQGGASGQLSTHREDSIRVNCSSSSSAPDCSVRGPPPMANWRSTESSWGSGQHAWEGHVMLRTWRRDRKVWSIGIKSTAQASSTNARSAQSTLPRPGRSFSNSRRRAPHLDTAPKGRTNRGWRRREPPARGRQGRSSQCALSSDHPRVRSHPLCPVLCVQPAALVCEARRFQGFTWGYLV